MAKMIFGAMLTFLWFASMLGMVVTVVMGTPRQFIGCAVVFATVSIMLNNLADKEDYGD